MHKRQSVLLPPLFVEIRGQKPTGFIGQQGINAYCLPPGQMVLKSLIGQW
jgi:hypothetical protein